MSDQDNASQNSIVENSALVINAFGKSPAFSLDMSNVREAERRLVEAKVVNPITYSDLENTFSLSYRDLKRFLSVIGYQIAQAEKFLEEAKATVLLDKYPEFIASRPKGHDSADIRKAFLSRDPEYSAALDRLNQMKALESNFDGKIKVIENVCRYMRKQMDLVLRSGLSGKDYYNTQGRK